jgi:hypothetical protein
MYLFLISGLFCGVCEVDLGDVGLTGKCCIDVCAKAIGRAFVPCQATATTTATASGARCIHPTHRDVAAMNGHPALARQRQRQKQIPPLRCGMTNKNGQRQGQRLVVRSVFIPPIAMLLRRWGTRSVAGLGRSEDGRLALLPFEIAWLCFLLRYGSGTFLPPL